MDAASTPSTGDGRFVLDNAAIRTMRRYAIAFERQDWDALLDIHSSASVVDDQRVGLRSRLDGNADAVRNLRTMAEIGTRRVIFTPLAIRSDHLVLGLWAWTGVDADFDFRVETLVVNEIDDDGRHTAGVLFEPERIDDAFAELNTRWFELGARDESHGAVRFLEAINRKDFDGLRALMTDDFVYVDHRPVSFGSTGPDEYVERSRTLSRLGDFKLRILRDFEAARPEDVFLVRREGKDEHGNDVSWEYLAVGQIADGRLSRTEVFPAERLNDALERARELGRNHE